MGVGQGGQEKLRVEGGLGVVQTVLQDKQQTLRWWEDDVERRAREDILALRKSRAAVRVTPFSYSMAKARGIASPPTARLMVASHVVDHNSLRGLQLVDQHMVVVFTASRENASAWTSEVSYGKASVSYAPCIDVWGSELTFYRMSKGDWGFVEDGPLGAPVPAYVTSHLRCLAFYSALQFAPGSAYSLALLQRWTAAVAAVRDGAESLRMLYGDGISRSHGEGPVLDMTFEQALASRDKDLAWAWAGWADTLVGASETALRHARAAAGL